MNWIVNNIQLTWKLARMLKTYNSTVRFSKYEFYNKLLDGITLLRVTPDITWTQIIYIYIFNVRLLVYHRTKTLINFLYLFEYSLSLVWQHISTSIGIQSCFSCQNKTYWSGLPFHQRKGHQQGFGCSFHSH